MSCPGWNRPKPADHAEPAAPDRPARLSGLSQIKENLRCER
jgi:hypothetical protein